MNKINTNYIKVILITLVVCGILLLCKILNVHILNPAMDIRSDNFDYQSFATNLSDQAPALVPHDVSESCANYVVSNVKEYSLNIGEQLAKDSRYSNDDKYYIVQVIAEWIFHKSVDLCHSDIPEKYWNDGLQEVSTEIFSTLEETKSKHTEGAEELNKVEETVNKTFNNYIDNLAKQGRISKESAQHTKTLSNIDDYSGLQNEQ